MIIGITVPPPPVGEGETDYLGTVFGQDDRDSGPKKQG